MEQENLIPEDVISIVPTKRVCVYIDGFNFYHNLKALYPDRKKYRWINYKALVQQFLGIDEVINGIYLFTAYYTKQKISGRYKRHKLFVRAVMVKGIQVILGNFLSKEKKLYTQNITGVIPPDMKGNVDDIEVIKYKTKEEKKTDVNLAIKMVEDAYENRFDIAYIVSCDTDIVPVITLIKKKFPDKIIVNLRIANSIGRDMENVCHRCIDIAAKHIEEGLLEDNVEEKNGNIISIPPEWLKEQPKLL